MYDFEVYAISYGIEGERRYQVVSDDTLVIKKAVIDKHQNEVEVLVNHFPELKLAVENGVSARKVISLQELASIIERKRVRIDAYNGLVSVLKTQNIELVIVSNKTKK